MDTVKQVVICACAVSIALSMADMMMPSERFLKQLRLLFSLILMIGVAAPVVKGEVSIREAAIAAAEPMSYTDTQSLVRENVCRSAQENLEAVLRAQLSAQGLACDALSVSIHIGEDDSISISEVRLCCADPEAAKRVIAAQLGTDVPVTQMEAAA